MNESLKRYIDQEILPLYDHFDSAHRRDHAEMVIRQSLQLAASLGVDAEMAYVIAAYHDTGLVDGRPQHHLSSGRIMREDQELRRWFTEEQIEMMAQAAEDHRASADHQPRSIYGRIVAEADRFIVPEKIIERTVQYGLDRYPELTREQQYQRALEHVRAKYGDGGYLRLWFDDSPNAARLEALRAIIRNERRLRSLFDETYNRLTQWKQQ